MTTTVTPRNATRVATVTPKPGPVYPLPGLVAHVTPVGGATASTGAIPKAVVPRSAMLTGQPKEVSAMGGQGLGVAPTVDPGMDKIAMIIGTSVASEREPTPSPSPEKQRGTQRSYGAFVILAVLLLLGVFYAGLTRRQ